MVLSHLFFTQRRRGFTLLELLAAMAILVLLVLCVTQILNGAIGTTKASRKKIDVDNEVRRIFDRMSADFAGMLNRPDADFLIRKNGGNDEIYFFSEASARTVGGDIPQSVALVGYQVNLDRQLVRFSQALSWDAAPPDGPIFLTFSTSSNNPKKVLDVASSIENAYAGVLTDEEKLHVLGEGVFRMEIDFILKPITTDPPGKQPAKFSISPFRSGGTGTFSNKGEDLSDVQAIVVTLVAIDPASRVIAGDLKNLAVKFSDSVDGVNPAEAWQAIANNSSSLEIPAIAASNVRVYQRIFSLSKFLTTSL